MPGDSDSSNISDRIMMLAVPIRIPRIRSAIEYTSKAASVRLVQSLELWQPID